MSLLSKTLALATSALIAASTLTSVAKADEATGQQLFPLFSYRTGPYAPSGIPQWAGYRDYFNYINEKGGVNGVKIFVQECETAYTLERAFECYERYKNGYAGAPVAVLFTTSSGFDAAISDKARLDKLPIISVAGGRGDAVDGSVFPYQFPLLFDYWTEASIVVEHIANQVGGYDKLKGLKIATLYHDSGYGRETIQPMAILSEKYGFENIQIAVPHPGEQQQAQWQQIKRAGVDWVFFRAWGVMSPVGLKTAARVGFPADRIIGDIWTGSEEDARPAGAAAKNYLAVSVFPSGTDFEITKELKKNVIDAGKGDLKDVSKFGSVYYNAGLVQAIIYTEILRTGQKKFGNRPLTKEEGQWAAEHLDITAERIAELGATGLLSPLKITPQDHEGDPAAKIVQWDGQKWNAVTDWLKGDRPLFRDAIYARAAAYAKEKGIEPRQAQN
ncbi:amino acid/amide ABC transporter substrate-binding protein (HAAT family) [Rhizobium sp. PP-F2F-G38]|uniref:ABC transporter substrate-binding protein n=1 Tax=Rhizobium sp. PP-CC-3G-465 TaxID=2135648 RepID=UPI000D8A5B40|nr:amino acid/amide ABC transporter substrate-binding protein (HAAT family) [Rhizobium sp. PP-WC-1G-195]PYE94757.1 amino acid/amide ABC transporter substrate-binding protein (HAAT family) [Rhizobium sp. PP-F2F-G38]TCQ05423.1 amino acid/amide ABC transporter substrate-binding protein (HAAT family) [Rhizobium sp. PP-F2F-G36]TCQ26062.1 amino acid/amide ABC transporter substrate-binding protein (HAAT family) [Rhizobium sp. PP-CC-3G-465]